MNNRMMLLALAAVATMGWPSAAAAVAKAEAESTRVRRVTISDRGVEVERSSAPDGERVKVDIDVGAVRVRATGENWDEVVDGRGEDIVRVFGDAEVPAGQRANDVVAVFGSVTVEGEVMGDAVAVLGSLRLAPGAVVHGDAVAIGGVLEQPAGSTVGGETVSVAFAPRIYGLPPLSSIIMLVLAVWLFAILIGWLLALMFPERLVRVAVTASTRTGLSILLGIISGPLLIIAMCLLSVTVIGIPVAVLLPLGFLVVAWGGQVASAYLIGCRLMRRGISQSGVFAPVFAGTLFAGMFFVVAAVLAGPAGASRTVALFFAFLGLLIVASMKVLGIGAVLLSAFGTKPREPMPATPPSAAPGPDLGAAAPSVPAL